MIEISERTFGNRYYIVVITTLMIAVLIWVLSDRLERELLNAERAQLQLRVAELRAGVLLREASLVAKDTMAEAERYVGSNPMQWMTDAEGRRPAYYMGERQLSLLGKKQIEELKGFWVFDVEESVLVYFPRTDDILARVKETGLEPWRKDDQWGPRLKYRVVGLWSQEDEKKEIKGLRLMRVGSYHITPNSHEQAGADLSQ